MLCFWRPAAKLADNQFEVCFREKFYGLAKKFSAHTHPL
jgi:hypothetical protein